MKRKNVFTILLLIACTINLSAQKKQSSGPTVAEKNASKVIEYTNSIIEIANAYLETYKDYDHLIYMAETEMRAITSGSNKFPMKELNYKDTTTINSKYYTAYATTLKAAPATFSNRDKVIASYDAAQAGVQNLFKSSRALNRYFVNKEYKEDGKEYPTYYALKDSLATNAKKVRKLWQIASREASNAGSEAENLLLKKSPMGEFFIPMKTDLQTLKSFIEEIFSDDENIDWKSITTRSASLKAAFEKVKDGQGKNMNKLGSAKQAEFTNFYNSSIRLLEYIDQLVEVVNKTPAADDDQVERVYKKVSNQYNDVIVGYNYFATEQY
jgi:hypothetical protein